MALPGNIEQLLGDLEATFAAQETRAAAPKMVIPDLRRSSQNGEHLSENVTILGRRLSDVKPERIDWVWPGRIAVGKLTMIDGDPGLGKSTLTLDLAARITQGAPFPDGPARPPRGVVLLSAEDGVADTIRPRAEAAGADLRRVLILGELPDGSLPTIPGALPFIEAAVREMDAALLIVDPLVAYLGDGVNANRDQDVRRALAPLKELAERTGVAVAMIWHLNKASGASPLYRGGGSIGLIGAARFGLLVAADPDDPEKRLVASTKSNLSKPPATLAYRLASVPGADVARVEWLGTSSLLASSLLAASMDDGERGALDDAKQFLQDLLQEGPHPVKVIQRAAHESGIADQTLRRAKTALGVEAVKSGFGQEGHWTWRLPAVSKMLTESLRCSSPTHEHLRQPMSILDDGASLACVPEALRQTVENILALSAADRATYRAELDAADPDDPDRDHDRTALLWADWLTAP